MSRVYVINNATHDYAKAARYGELINVTEEKVPLFKTDTILNILKKGLQGFKSTDYLLVSGPSWLCIMAALVLFSKFDEAKFLVFDAKEQDYVVRHLNTAALSLLDKTN